MIGQDGFGVDDAHRFTATPGAFTFGVCSAAVAGESSRPAICSDNPANVPFVMDTIAVQRERADRVRSRAESVWCAAAGRDRALALAPSLGHCLARSIPHGY